jgi:hypothetical protein
VEQPVVVEVEFERGGLRYLIHQRLCVVIGL